MGAMQPMLSDLWRRDGTVDRGTYAFWGVLLGGLKYNFDRALASSFGRNWSTFNYLEPGGPDDVFPHLSPEAMLFFGALVLLATPFVWVGVILTLRRLRALSLSPWLVALFFVPLVNLLFFLALALMPDRAPAADSGGGSVRAWLDAFVPRGALGSAALSVLVTAAIGVVLTLLTVEVAKNYGWGLFVGMPFLVGMNAALLHGWHEPRSLASCQSTAMLALGVLGAGLLILAIEGLICLVMAAPLGLGLAMLGGYVGWSLQRRADLRAPVPPALLLLLVVLPLVMGAESRVEREGPLYEVVTAVEVDVPPERVWPYVVSFSALPPPSGWIYRLGVAHPVRARIEGTGVGAVRHCEFSTGAFVEPITRWEPPSRLSFDVASQPRPMSELSPWPGIEAPHLDGFLRSERGEFRLSALPGGRTRLEGSTWYRHRIWPAPYWRLFSDAIIHGIHEQVLAHVKRAAEAR